MAATRMICGGIAPRTRSSERRFCDDELPAPIGLRPLGRRAGVRALAAASSWGRRGGSCLSAPPANHQNEPERLQRC